MYTYSYTVEKQLVPADLDSGCILNIEKKYALKKFNSKVGGIIVSQVT